MKKSIILLITMMLLLLVSLVACSGDYYSETGTRYERLSSDDNRPYFYSEDYKGFYSNSEGDLKTIDLEYENPVLIKLDINTESGELAIKIVDSDGKEYYSGENLSTSTHEIILDKADTYTMILTAENHTGSFSITATDLEN